jgi:xylulokinase
MQLEEGAAYGAALLAGIRAGVFVDAADAVNRCVRVRDTVEPEWDYEYSYARFRSLYPTMKELR